MGIIRTVKQDIHEQKLGWCQCHEHLFIEKGPSYDINASLFMDDIGKSLSEIISYKNAGGVSLVDAQPFGCGRMAEHLQYVSEESGVNIIASTGFHKLEFYPKDSVIFRKSSNDIAQLFAEEINKGMYSSKCCCKQLDCRAGIIKVAVVNGGSRANKHYEKLFEAAAVAGKATGASIMCHLEKDVDAFDIINYFYTHSIMPHRLILCHLDRMRYDFAYHVALAETGTFLEYDTICRLNYHDNRKEIMLIRHIIKKGYAENILLSLDTTRRRLRSYGGEIGLDYILTDFTSQLKAYGVEDIYLNMFMRKNPQIAIAINIESNG